MVENRTSWRPGGRPALEDGEVHVWRVEADTHFSEVESLHVLLSPDEQDRAARFRYEIHRLRWVTGRAILRRILGRYLQADPAHLHFTLGPQGKPALKPARSPVGIHFNMSHSGNLALYAVGASSVGIDVEKVRSTTDVDGLARRWFTRNEHHALGELPARLRTDAFYTVWTRKEAYFKARGYGLTHGIDHVEVSVDPRTPASLLREVDDLSAPSRWSLADLPAGPGYKAAVAMENPGKVTALWDYTDQSDNP